MYNTTNLTNANTVIEIYEAVDKISNHSLTAMLMLTTFLIIFIVFSNYPKRVVLLADSFVMSIIGVWFFTLGWIGWPILLIPILVFFVSIFLWYFIPE